MDPFEDANWDVIAYDSFIWGYQTIRGGPRTNNILPPGYMAPHRAAFQAGAIKIPVFPGYGCGSICRNLLVICVMIMSSGHLLLDKLQMGN